jgi:predicted esterase
MSKECQEVRPECATFMGRIEEWRDGIDTRMEKGESRFDKLDNVCARLELALAKLPSAVDVENRLSTLERAAIYSRGYSKGALMVASLLGGIVVSLVGPLVKSVLKI